MKTVDIELISSNMEEAVINYNDKVHLSIEVIMLNLVSVCKKELICKSSIEVLLNKKSFTKVEYNQN